MLLVRLSDNTFTTGVYSTLQVHGKLKIC